MIVDSMTWQEIASELVCDLVESDVIAISTRWIRERQKKYVRAYGDRRQRCRFKELYIKSSRNNDFYIVPIAMNKTSLKKNGAYKIYIAFFPYRGGMCVCTLGTNGVNKVTPDFYLPHFFDRYKERFSGDEKSQAFKDFVFDFFLYNGESTTKRTPDSKYGEDAIFTRCIDGIMLGYEYGNIHLYKTFISDDLLFDDQIEQSYTLEMKLYDYMNKNQLESYNVVEKLTEEELALCSDLREVLKSFGGRIPMKNMMNKI